ncbi:response regulator [Escherichia coli]
MQENYKILVVDDDMRLRALLERYLTEQGFQVRSVANAEQMDRLLTRESFHLMVLDLMFLVKMACRIADVFVVRATRCRSLW